MSWDDLPERISKALEEADAYSEYIHLNIDEDYTLCIKLGCAIRCIVIGADDPPPEIESKKPLVLSAVAPFAQKFNADEITVHFQSLQVVFEGADQ